MTILWDHIMTSLECCGARNFNDFATVPASCCIDDAFNSTVSGLASCPDPTTGTLPLQMQTGCSNLLIMGSIPAIASSLAVVVLFQVRDSEIDNVRVNNNLVFQIAGVILSCWLARKVEDQREWYEMRSM